VDFSLRRRRLGSVGAPESVIKTDQPLIERFLRASVNGQLFAQSNRSGTLPDVVKTLKVKEQRAQKIFDLSLPGFTHGGFVEENLQKESVSPSGRSLGDQGAAVARSGFQL